MINESTRMDVFKTSIFTELAKEKAKVEAQGKSVLDFSIGSPDIAPSKPIIETMIEAVAVPENYRYAVVTLPSLIEEIQHWYKTRYNVDLEANEICLLQGSQEALFNLPLVFCNPGDAMLVPNPQYPIYAQAPLFAGADVIQVPLYEENGYLMNVEALDPEIIDRTKLLLLCYPNNPTGAIAPVDYLERMIAFAKEHNLLIIYDNAYSELIFEGSGISFLSLPGAKDVAIELNSFSKTYGMAGARLGVMLGNAQAISYYKTLKSNMDYGVFLPIQLAGKTALQTDRSIIENTRNQYKQRRDLMIRLFGEAGWKLPCPPATMFIWARIPDQYKNSVEFSKDLLSKTGIMVTPGVAFGSQGERYVRIALVHDESMIEDAAKRLKESGFFA